MQTIYFDYSTSTPIAASVRDSMLPFLGEFYGHPSSAHWVGRASQEAIEDARSNLASLLGCHPAEIVFTSGGTESVNLALLGIAKAVQKGLPEGTPHLITTHLEHSCVRLCADYLASTGWTVTRLGCDSSGVISPSDFERSINEHTRVASIIHANHRVGTIQPLQEIAEICQQRDILLHTDACQSIGKVTTLVDELGVDLLSLSGHKIYAPKGIGALYIRMGVPLEPIMFGEGCEAGLRPGTANVPHIVGLGHAAKLAQASLGRDHDQIANARETFLSLLERELGHPLRVHGSPDRRLPHILSFELPGVSSERMQQMLPEICFCPNTYNGNGTAATRTTNPTHACLGLTPEQSASTLRLSFGWNTTESDVIKAAQMIAVAYDSLAP